MSYESESEVKLWKLHLELGVHTCMTSIGAVEDHFEDVLEAERTFERKKEVQKEPSRFLCSVRLQPAKVDKVAIESSRM